MASFTLCSMNNRRNTVKTHGNGLAAEGSPEHICITIASLPSRSVLAAAEGAFQGGHSHYTDFSFFELQSRMRRP